MPANSYTEWTEDDVRTLDIMYRNDIPLDQIAKALERTPRAIEHALRNLLTQEVLHTDTHHVAMKYNMRAEELCAELAPAKYYLREPQSPTASSYLVWTLGSLAAIAVLSTYL